MGWGGGLSMFMVDKELREMGIDVQLAARQVFLSPTSRVPRFDPELGL